ncbi:PAS-domain containing protein [Pelagibius sp. Alg239-R121]|uniref:sensor histidine kinase n=1 Tax=Pelagibius sp. Alg239-R121 TaxID=2993448 RepID=UPI0024A71C7C|nr:PAS-domain containing protein [Pelagibius sp. Alg239-R121]
MAGLPVYLPGLLLAAIGVTGAVLLALAYRKRWLDAEAAVVNGTQQARILSTVLSSAPFACLAFHHESGRLNRSGNLAAILGMNPEQVTSLEDICAAFFEHDGRQLSESDQALKTSGENFILSLRHRDGTRIFEALGLRSLSGEGTPVADSIWFRDVTAQQSVLNSAMRETEDLSTILDALQIPIWRRDTDLNLTYCNAAYASALDTTPEGAMAESLELLGLSQGRIGQAIAQRAKESGKMETESHHIVVGGARRLYQVKERPLKDGRLIGYAFDDTTREDLQLELTRHIDAQATVLENLGTAIAILGPDMRLKFFNSAYAALWRIDEDFLNSGPDMSDILDAARDERRLPEYANYPEFKQQRLREFRTMIEPLEELQHLPDGNTLRMVATPHPFGGVLMTYEDVTDRLTLERSYNTLIDVQRETLDNLYEGVAVYGADGRLKLSNPAFARIWNLPVEMLSSEPHARQVIDRMRDFFDVTPEEWPEILETMVAQATEAESMSGRFERADGSIVDWAQVPLPDGASLYTFLDVTDSIRVERALLERNEALETADRLKSEFIANISYELRTPLNAIVGFAEILENQFFGSLNERQLEYSHAIVESSQRLMTLINDILDLASIEAGYLHLDRTETSISGLLETIETLGHERALNRNIRLKLDCPDDAGTAFVDERRLKQALFNLLSNAIKFTPQGGSVTLGAERSDNMVCLRVTDTGVGIPGEDQARVFGKFEVSGGQSRQSGAGLGLSLVKSLVEMHGGWVELESTEGKGTTVTCHIPSDPPGA